MNTAVYLRSGLRLATAALLLTLAGCTQLAFFAANSRAAVGHYQATYQQSYGPEKRQQLDIYRPESPSGLPRRPVILFVHGGGWNSGDKSQYRFVGASLAEHGYVAVLPNYRLYPQARLPDFMDDIARALIWTRDHAAQWGGDPTRIYLAGHSAGAHIVTLLTLDTRYLAAHGADDSLIKGVIGLAGPYDFLPFRYSYMADLFGPETNYPISQPIHFARRNVPPMLLLHGLADKTVAPDNTRHLAAALRQAGNSVVDRYYPEASHGALVAAFSSLTRHPVPVLQEIEDFLLVKPFGS